MKLKNWHVLAVISCILWLAYYPALSAPLNSVDDVRLAHDLLNHTPFSWADFWMPRSKSFFRPLVNSSFILDSLIWGFEASFLHLENLLLHWLNTLLVYYLARVIAERQGLNTLAVPAAAALLFGLHPINTEAVIWIAGRADLLAATFVLLSLGCMLHYLRDAFFSWGCATVLTFFAGTLAKETAIFVLPGLFALGWIASKEKVPAFTPPLLSRTLLPPIACLCSLAVYAMLRSLALRTGDLGFQHVSRIIHGSEPVEQVAQEMPLAVSAWHETLQTAFSCTGYYARKLVQPFPLNFGIIDIGHGYFWLGCLLVPLGIYLVWHLSWWSCFILTSMSLASIALLVALGDFSWTPYAERYMYAPSALLALGICLWSGRLPSAQRYQPGWGPWLTGAFGLLVVLCAWAVFQRGVVWQDNLTLFADTVRKSPNFALAQNELARAFWERGERQEALDILARIEMPESQQAFLNKVLILLEEDKLFEARQFLLESLARPQTQAYHTVILERLVDVVERQREASSSPAQSVQYDNEIIGYLQQLWQRTGKPFYLYRLGQRQLAKSDYAAARDSFAMAYVKLPPESIYREPARKLAEKLSRK